jgi:hypothetical protein
MWSAVYLPAGKDLTKHGFATQYEAMRHALCDECFDAVKSGGQVPLCACSAEWVVMETANFEACETSEDVFEEAGWKKIWEREPQKHRGDDGAENPK